MAVVPESTAIAQRGYLYTFPRGFLVAEDAGIAITQQEQAFLVFTAHGGIRVIAGAQVVAVNRGALYTFSHGLLSYTTDRIGTFSEISIYPVPGTATGTQVFAYDPAIGTVLTGPTARTTPSTSNTNWNQQGVTFIPPQDARFVLPLLSFSQGLMHNRVLYFDAFNMQAVDKNTALAPATDPLEPWSPPRALEVEIVADPHVSYEDLTNRLSIMNRVLQQSVPLGMRVLEPTFSG